MSIFNRQEHHNREMARIKYSQEEVLEEQTLVAALNNSLPRPLNLSDFQQVGDRVSEKIRQQRIIAENIAYSVQ